VSPPGEPRPTRHLGAALVAALLSLAPLLLGTGPLAGPRDIPLGGLDDELGQHVWVKVLTETGGVLLNPRLGLPEGQVLADFPQAALSPVQVGLVRALLLVAPPEEVVNLYLALTFPLVALSAYAVLALGGARPRWALLGAALFATTPYHFGRSSMHLFHSGYFGIPWLGAACCWLLRGAPGGPSGRGAGLACLGLGVVLGAVEPYYTAFALALLPCCAALGGVAHGRRPLLRGLALTASVAAVVACTLLPVRAELAGRGVNPVPLTRFHAESEAYGLKLTSLLVPSPDHRNPWMQEWARWYGTAPLTNENRLNSAGLLGGLGILGILGGLLAGGGRPDRGRLLPDARTEGGSCSWSCSSAPSAAWGRRWPWWG
jgi:phosphoglycerol transferase